MTNLTIPKIIEGGGEGGIPGLAALFIPTALVVLLAGCKVEEGQGVKVVTADTPPPGPLPEKGIVIDGEKEEEPSDVKGDEESVESLAQRQRSKRSVRIMPGETTQLFSQWSSIVVEDINALNDGKNWEYGQKWTLSLTNSEFEEFERKRKEHWDNKTRELYQTKEIKLIEYTVKRGDTVGGIAKKFGTPMWLLVLHNQTINPYSLSPGAKVNIPILSPRKQLPDESQTAAGKLREESKKAEKAGNRGAGSAKGEEEETEGISIIVKRGDSLGAYAKWGGITIGEIEQLNPGITKGVLRVGETVRLPLTPEQFEEFQSKRGKKKRRERPTYTPPGDKPVDEMPEP